MGTGRLNCIIMLQESTNYPTVNQKKAVAKTLGDLISHGKSRVSPNDEKMFFYIASHVLGLKEMEIIDAIKNMNNGFLNFNSIGQMNKTYQIAFRNLMYQLITIERIPTYTEKKILIQFFLPYLINMGYLRPMIHSNNRYI